MAQNRPRPSSSDCATIVKRGYLHDKRTGILLVSSLLPRELCVVQWGDPALCNVSYTPSSGTSISHE